MISSPHENLEPSASSFDAVLPVEMAVKAEQAGVKKAQAEPLNTFVLAILAGAFISMGAIFSTTVLAGTSGEVPFGISRLLAGLSFSLGLILVIVGGAELFTGNNLIIMAWASRRVRTALLLRNWSIVYLGNFAGALATAGIVYASGQFTFGRGSVGVVALDIANAKVLLTPLQALVLGMLCNALVCLAVWLSYSARSTTDRILAIVPPTAAFVAAGFEHSVANMYFIPIGLFIKYGAPSRFWAEIGRDPADYASLTWEAFLLDNLLPVSLGNVIGGAVMVGAVYWFVYLRNRADDTREK